MPKLLIMINEKGKWWKVYFWLLVMMTLLDIGSSIFSEEIFEVSTFLHALIGAISLVGLLGYVYQTPILLRNFWAGVLFANLLVLSYAAYNIYNNWTTITEDIATDDVIWFFGVGFIFIVPLLVALYSYVFSSSQLWRKTK